MCWTDAVLLLVSPGLVEPLMKLLDRYIFGGALDLWINSSARSILSASYKSHPQV
jgi:hypothetical protein